MKTFPLLHSKNIENEKIDKTLRLYFNYRVFKCREYCFEVSKNMTLEATDDGTIEWPLTAEQFQQKIFEHQRAPDILPPSLFQRLLEFLKKYFLCCVIYY